VAASVTIHHNLDPRQFVWLWMKYVAGADFSHHCTNVLRGRYSKKLSKHNCELTPGVTVVCDEQRRTGYSVLYVCGVAKRGYSKKKNYPHNLHLPIQPMEGERAEFSFEQWHLTIDNGRVLPIPREADLPESCRGLPSEFTTCRIFRWAVGHFGIA
jgi:hypothetical protein